jgi:hypothetical protein
MCQCPKDLKRAVKAPIGSAGACERPRWVVCLGCDAKVPVQCQSGSRAKCGHCADVKHGDLKAVFRSGFDRPGDFYGLLTLTAPGRDVLPWDTDFCGHLEDGSECAGHAGCRVEPVSLAAWHASLARRWSWFVTYLRRCLPECSVEYAKVYELQARGALHVHAPLRIVGPVSERRVRAALRLCASRWGFGRQVDYSPIGDDRSVARAAGYVAKYVTKGYDSLTSVSMLDVHTGELRSQSVRPWSASRHWGDTIRSCRARRVSFWAGAQAATAAAPALGAACSPLDLYLTHSTIEVSAVPQIPSVECS